MGMGLCSVELLTAHDTGIQGLVQEDKQEPGQCQQV